MSDETQDATAQGAAPSEGVAEKEGFAGYELDTAREPVVVGATALFVLVFPYVFARMPVVSGILQGYQGLATLMLIWGIFALGFDLLLGYTGLLSFGHAAFWGGSAYAAGVFSQFAAESLGFEAGPVIIVVVGTLFAVLLAWGLGFLSLRRGGIYFSILTLAFAQMMFYLSSAPLSGITGGENGFTAVTVGHLFGVFELESELPSVLGTLMGTWLYAFVGLMTVVSVAVAYRILNSPYGMVFRAIRENEQRTEFVGLNVWRYKLMSFVISGAFAGVAGSLFTIHGNYVPLQSLYWTESGEIVIMAVLGGAGSLFGPMLGAGIYLYFENIVSGVRDLTVPFTDIVLLQGFGEYWHLLLGVLFVLVVWFFPRGIWGLFQDLRNRVTGGDSAAETGGER
ncbi:branched-chain amino acid ABC transporter permease [Halobium salinum]|uniref:Branched-chain amino acid ABC transporter permease n=1 Tax=Halobium salinum TaxID=1364940 RepID=A0ABD5PD21_9EURY|nr:branched-chain amino acid ABC transporter permease [Halobium salinum]